MAKALRQGLARAEIKDTVENPFFLRGSQFCSAMGAVIEKGYGGTLKLPKNWQGTSLGRLQRARMLIVGHNAVQAEFCDSSISSEFQRYPRYMTMSRALYKSRL